MSSSQQNNNQNSETRSMNKEIELLPMLIAIESFEELQLLNLQAIINQLALQIQKGFKTNENGEQTPPLAILRVYAQYLNLYMKFKDKSIKSGSKKQEQPQPNTKNPIHPSVKTSGNTIEKKPDESVQQMVQPLPIKGETPNVSLSKKESMHDFTNLNRLPHDSNTNSQHKKALNGT